MHLDISSTITPHQDIANHFLATRAKTVALAAPLSEADMQIQAAAFASPSKWHLAHTSWFFDTFILKQYQRNVQGFDAFDFLFNSYYVSLGERQPQAGRGLMSRPSLREIVDYRQAVDEAMLILLKTPLSDETLALVMLGIQHEQQHQELFLTDILYNLSYNPLYPAYDTNFATQNHDLSSTPASMVAFSGGLISIGCNNNGFCYDNEQPCHSVFIAPFEMANQLITNAQWITFIEAGGYEDPLLWLSDGWQMRHKEAWTMPLYWQKTDGGYMHFGLQGLIKIQPDMPVCHISFYEADAYVRWVCKRLPTEFEWEYALTSDVSDQLKQCFNHRWQWTASPYIAYPGFKISDGAVGEYNGKFMNGQYVLRGSAFATAPNHSRTTYRNFFYPHQRWQFAGLRLAQSII